jgi:uncharacterized protein (DUF433 family)
MADIVIGKEKTVVRKELLNRITVNPEVLVGKPTIRGMRISVEQILDALAAGVSEEELLEDYPALEADDIRAVVSYARDQQNRKAIAKLQTEFEDWERLSDEALLEFDNCCERGTALCKNSLLSFPSH